MKMALSKIAFLLVLALCTNSAIAQKTEITLDVTPKEGTTDDQYVVTVRLTLDGLSGADKYWPPRMDDFEQLGPPQRQQFSSTVIDPVRGVRIQNIEVIHYTVRAQTPGRFRIGPAKVRVKGKEIGTRTHWIKVIQGSGDPTQGLQPREAGDIASVPGFVPPDRRGGPEAFLQAVADKTTAFVGEQITVSWILYSRSGLLRFEPQSPSLKGVWSETLYEPSARPRYGQVRVGGIPYLATVVSQRALFALESGKLELEPYRASISTERTPSRRPISVVSPRLSVKILSLPKGAPPGFDPTYVGKFRVEAASDRGEIQADESLTLKLKVVAEKGAIRNTSPPEISFPGFTFRTPRDFEEKIGADAMVLSGERTYRYWTTPKQGGQQILPPIKITYFDPENRTYEVAKTEPIPVNVVGEPGLKEGGDTRENIIRRDIRPNRRGEVGGGRLVAFLYRRWWYWVLTLLPLVAFVLVVGIDKFRQSLKKETPRTRLRRARGSAKRRLRAAEIHLRGNRPAKFFGELSRVVHEHLEERIGFSVQSMTREEMRNVLKEKGLGDGLVFSLETRLEEFDFARFAKSGSTNEQMQSALESTRSLLKQIEKIRIRDEEEEVAS